MYSRFRRVKWIGRVSNILGTVEDSKSKSRKEISRSEITRDRTKLKSCRSYKYRFSFKHVVLIIVKHDNIIIQQSLSYSRFRKTFTSCSCGILFSLRETRLQNILYEAVLINHATHLYLHVFLNKIILEYEASFYKI